MGRALASSAASRRDGVSGWSLKFEEGSRALAVSLWLGPLVGCEDAESAYSAGDVEDAPGEVEDEDEALDESPDEGR